MAAGLERDPREGDGAAFVKCLNPDCPCATNPRMRPPRLNPPPKPAQPKERHG